MAESNQHSEPLPSEREQALILARNVRRGGVGMSWRYVDVPLLGRELLNLIEQLGAAQEKLGWYERTQWVRRLKEERDRADAATAKLNDIATREWRDEGGRIAAAIARDGLTVTNLANPPITKERPRDAGTSGATT